MNQVQHQQVDQQLNMASVGRGAPAQLRTCDDQGNDLKIPLVVYTPEEWAQLLSAQKSSIRKRCAVANSLCPGTHCGGHAHPGGGDGGGARKHQRENCRNCDPKSDEYPSPITLA